MTAVFDLFPKDCSLSPPPYLVGVLILVNHWRIRAGLKMNLIHLLVTLRTSPLKFVTLFARQSYKMFHLKNYKYSVTTFHIKSNSAHLILYTTCQSLSGGQIFTVDFHSGTVNAKTSPRNISFQPPQSQHDLSKYVWLRKLYYRQHKQEASKAEIRPEERNEKAGKCRENLWNKIQLKGP